jgi:hypothetical protein
LLTACCVAGQIGHGRQRLLLTCRVTRPFYQDQHVRGSLQWGCAAAVRCVRACACPMILTAVQPSLAGFTAVAVLLWTERFAGRQLRLPLALGYLGIGAAMLFTMGPAGLATLFAHLQHH